MVSTTSYTYNTDGILTTESIDNNGDGIANSVINYNVVAGYSDPFDIIYTYNDQDNLISRTLVFSYDSSVSEISNFTYDSNGNLTSESVSYIDGDGNLTLGSKNIYSYDANGDRTFESYDNNGDGNPDLIKAFTYDDNGNITSELTHLSKLLDSLLILVMGYRHCRLFNLS
jgi:serralysin